MGFPYLEVYIYMFLGYRDDKAWYGSLLLIEWKDKLQNSILNAMVIFEYEIFGEAMSYFLSIYRLC